jgi:hypothetical protein
VWFRSDVRIIVYCLNEFDSARVATVMFQRGVDNIYLLTGGLQKMCKKYPEVLVVAPGKKAPFPPDHKLLQLRGDLNAWSHGSDSGSLASVSTGISQVSSVSTAKYLEKKLGRPVSGPSSSSSSSIPLATNPGNKPKRQNTPPQKK